MRNNGTYSYGSYSWDGTKGSQSLGKGSRIPQQWTWTHIRSDVTRTQKASNNWRPPTNYVSTAYEQQWVTGGFGYEQLLNSNGVVNPHIRINGSGDLVATPSMSTYFPFTSNTENRLIAAALAKLKDQSLNVSVAIAEMHKTAEHLGKTTVTLLTAYSAARKGQWSKVRKTLGIRKDANGASKSGASRWLEYKYAWIPLMLDIEGSYKTLTKDARSKDMVIVAKSRVREGGTLLDINTRTVDVGAGRFRLVKDEIRYQSEMKVSLWYKMDLPALAKAAELGLLNPLTVAWELTPWSFVIDWALPVGDVLDSLDADFGARFIGGSITQYTKQTAKTTVYPYSEPPQNGSNVSHTGSGAAKSYRVDTRRDVYKSSPKPLLFVKNPFSLDHAITASALVRSLRR